MGANSPQEEFEQNRYSVREVGEMELRRQDLFEP